MDRSSRRSLALVVSLAAAAGAGAWVALGRRESVALPVITSVEPTAAAGQAPTGASEYRELRLTSDRGVTDIRYYAASGARAGVIWLPGAHREWRGPANGLYPRLAGELRGNGFASAWVRFVGPQRVQEAVTEALIALSYLLREGITAAAAVGHSFGGAVAINAAAAAPQFGTVITLATQAEQTGNVSRLGPRCSILLIHGEADRVLPPINSAEVYARASEPRRFERLPRAGHALDEAAGEVARLTGDWLRRSLG